MWLCYLPSTRITWLAGRLVPPCVTPYGNSNGRIWRTWLERLLSWDRAYEAQAHRGSQEITQRAKTPETAQALLLARCFVEEGVPLTDQKLQVEVRGDLIIVTHPPTQFFAIYAKPNNRSELVLKRRTDTGDNNLLVQVWRAANTKARELGWIV